MTKPYFDIAYETGATAPYVDWVAGGNFDGYIHKKTIQFIESSNQVIVKYIVLDKSRYDGDVNDSEIFGKFEYTDKDTITIEYGEIKMRGKILGEKKEFIVFDLLRPSMDFVYHEVYQIK